MVSVSVLPGDERLRAAPSHVPAHQRGVWRRSGWRSGWTSDVCGSQTAAWKKSFLAEGSQLQLLQRRR